MPVTDVKTAAEFDALLASSPGGVVAHYWATWCEPCGAMDQLVRQLSSQWTGVAFARVEAEEDSAAYIMGTFAETLAGRAFGIFFAIVVVITIFGSVFSMFAGMIYLPGAAAQDGIPGPEDDSYIWLEEARSDEALDWVRS